MKEKDVEARLKRQIERLGGRCLKFVSPGMNGVPDRIILLPGGVMAFAELKAPGRRERKLQLYVQGRLRALGFTVFSAVDSYAKIEEIEWWAATQMSLVERRNAKATHGAEVEP